MVRRLGYLLFLCLIYGLVASSTLHAFLQKWRTMDHWDYSFENVVSYETPKPYVYRALMPVLINALYDVGFARKVFENDELVKRGVGLYVREEAVRQWSPELQVKYIIAGFAMFLFLLLALFSLRGMTRAAYPDYPVLADVGPVVFGLMLPLSFRGDGGFIYDFAGFGLFFLGLLLLFKGRYYAYLFLLPVIIVNKDSNVLLIFFSAVILFSRMPRKEAAVHLCLQGIVSAVVFLRYGRCSRSIRGGESNFICMEVSSIGCG